MARPPATRPATRTAASQVLDDDSETSLLDVIDNALNKGIVLSGDVTLALAQVDLVYVRLSLLLCAADRVLPTEDSDLIVRRSQRRARRRG